jgi:hypothetical protein
MRGKNKILGMHKLFLTMSLCSILFIASPLDVIKTHCSCYHRDQGKEFKELR